MFNTINDRYHTKLRRAVSNAYAMSTLVTFEPFVDSTIKAFIKQLQVRYADRPGDSGICDFGTWLQYYAFDVIGELTYSKRLGFVDNGVDVDHIIRDLEHFLNYASVVSNPSANPQTDYMMTAGLLVIRQGRSIAISRPLSDEESNPNLDEQAQSFEFCFTGSEFCKKAHG